MKFKHSMFAVGRNARSVSYGPNGTMAMSAAAAAGGPGKTLQTQSSLDETILRLDGSDDGRGDGDDNNTGPPTNRPPSSVTSVSSSSYYNHQPRSQSSRPYVHHHQSIESVPPTPPLLASQASFSSPPSSLGHHHHHPQGLPYQGGEGGVITGVTNRKPVYNRPYYHLLSYVSPPIPGSSGDRVDEVVKTTTLPEPIPDKSTCYWRIIFKILIILLSFAGFLYQATDICTHYYSYRTVVYTNTEQDALVDLPSITFCLPTYFTKKTLEELYEPYIKRNVDETSAFKNQSMLDAIKPVIYETFQKQAFKDLSAQDLLSQSISDDGIIECRLFYPPQHWPNLTRERMYEIVQYGLPCDEVTQVISSINANGKCFTFFSQLLTDNDSLKAYQQQQTVEPQVEYQQYPQMTSFATSSASSASTHSSSPTIVTAASSSTNNRYVPVSHKIAVNHGYRFHSGRFIRMQVQFNRDQYTVISDGHQRECIQVHPPFKIPSEACLHSINPGMSYDFVLTKTKAILQPPPYQTNCQSYQAVTQAESELLASTSDPSELKEFYLKPMSRSDCIDKCMIHIYEKYCGCLPIHISIWQRSSLFLNMSVCDYEDYERISPCLEKELSSTCYDTCKSDCIDRHYHLHVESRVYPSDEHIRQSTGVERLRLEKLRQSAATISIWSNYLSDITYVHTPAMSLIQLICYLGGLAGLWLGVSVMTVSGWIASLYPLMQKCSYRQRYIWLNCRHHVKGMLGRLQKASRTDYDAAECSYMKQTFLPSEACLVDDATLGGGNHRLQEHVDEDQEIDFGDSLIDDLGGEVSVADAIASEQGQACDATFARARKLGNEALDKVVNSVVVVASSTTNVNSVNSSVVGSIATTTTTTTSMAHASTTGTVTSHFAHTGRPNTLAGRRSVYWSNYSSMSTSSDDISLISSCTTSTTASGMPILPTAGRRMSLCNTLLSNMTVGKFANYKV